jgi:hypothetical protein
VFANVILDPETLANEGFLKKKVRNTSKSSKSLPKLEHFSIETTRVFGTHLQNPIFRTMEWSLGIIGGIGTCDTPIIEPLNIPLLIGYERELYNYACWGLLKPMPGET